MFQKSSGRKYGSDKSLQAIEGNMTEHKQIIGWVRDGSAFEVRNPKLMGKFELVASRIKFHTKAVKPIANPRS